ncbi:MAG: M64 family metallopeptidase [Lachnospiraceae bacterium]
MRLTAVLLALMLTVSGISVPTVYAADLESAVTESTDDALVSGTEEPEETVEVEEGADTVKAEEPVDESTEDIAAIEQAAALNESSDDSSEDSVSEDVVSENDVSENDSAAALEDNSEETEDTDPVGELKLVYGDETLADEDALVLLIMGDGFTKEEQEKFYEEAANTAEYMMDCSPFDEFTDVFKIYALGTVSNESGARGDEAESQAEAEADTCDTYFGATFWSWGMQRLVTLSEEGEAKGEALKEEYLPLADFNVYLVNSETYGGSGGTYCVASLNTQSLEMMLHELGHTIGDLADEYYASGYEGEYANLTAESDPEKVVWSRFIGKNGVGVYDWGGITGTGYYIPHTGCKMQYLGEEYPFCEVCKEQLRKSFCKYSNVTKIFFQTYADEFTAGEGKDMSEYFILRKGSSETTGDQLGDALSLTYYDAAGSELSGIPSAAGTYTVKAEFSGNDTYEACTAEGTYTIDRVSISLNIPSKSQDGKPADLSFDIKGEENYSIGIVYEGYQYYTHYVYDYYYSSMYSDTPLDTSDDVYDVYYCRYDSYYDEYLDKEEYQSAEGPVDPGDYTVTLTVYDADYNVLGEKSQEFSIYFNTTKLVNNNDSYYYGASDGANNKNIIIFGEGFTEKEQKKFQKLAEKFAEGILAEEPFKETKLYFNFTAVNCISDESGIGTEAKDSFFQLTRDEDGKIVASYDATVMTAMLAYGVNGYYDDCIIIVNDKKAKESSVYGYNTGAYSGYHTVFATPDKKGIKYAASEILNHLTGSEIGYRAETEEDKEAQRLALIGSLYYDYSPIIVSRAYNEKFIANGTAYDLTSYFQVYYGEDELVDVPLKLTYYADDHGKPGEALESAPSKPGTYHVLAETVPYDPYNPDENYWYWYQPEGVSENDGLWLGMSRGWTTYTIQPAKCSKPSGSQKPGSGKPAPVKPCKGMGLK